MRWVGDRAGLLGIGKRDRRTVFGFQRGESGSRIFLRLQMSLRASDCGLRGIEIGRRALRSSRDACGGDRLTRVAHLLHWSAAAAGEPDKSRKKDKRTFHDNHRH